MCQDCNPIESNTGVIQYSGPDLELCNGVTITNGELLTSVIVKFDNCIGALQSELDITGLIENSPCIDLVQTSLKTVLQSILDAQSEFCEQLASLEIQVTNLQNQINNFPGNKVINITACDPSRVQVTADTATQKSFKINGLVPPKTILPYFGSIADFSPTGLGLSNGPAAGWAIANGQSHTIGGVTYTTINAIGTSPNDLGRYIKYGPTVITTPSGNNIITLDAPNIPQVPFTINANFDLDFTGETDLAGNHRHQIMIEEDDLGNCGTPGIFDGNQDMCNMSVGMQDPESGDLYKSNALVGSSGEHSHEFTVNSTATGSFNATVGNEEPDSIDINPRHIQAIPIQFLGCS
jgi:hypothetical protein